MPERSHSEAERLIAEFIIAQLNPQVTLESLSPDTHLLEGNIIQSLQLLRLVLFLEETFHVKVPARDLRAENFATLGTVEAMLRALGAAV